MRILGLDFGSKTVGVAVSDGLLLTAQGVETIERKDENKLRKTCARIEELIAEYEITEIVLGLPKNMNNTEGERVEKTKAFGEMLERRTGLPVHYWDERLTTVAAEQILMESGVRRENRKAVIDKVAAGLILQGYLDCLKTKEKNNTKRYLRTFVTVHVTAAVHPKKLPVEGSVSEGLEKLHIFQRQENMYGREKDHAGR